MDFVDKEITLGWDEVHIARKDPNKKFVMGTAAVPPKVRYPPYLGPAFVRKRKLKSWLMGTWFAETTADDEDQEDEDEDGEYALVVNDVRTITTARMEKRMIAIAFSGDLGAREATILRPAGAARAFSVSPRSKCKKKKCSGAETVRPPSPS